MSVVIITVALLTQKNVTHERKPIKHSDITWHRARATPTSGMPFSFTSVAHCTAVVPSLGVQLNVSPTSDCHWMSPYGTNPLLPGESEWEVCAESCATCNHQFEADSKFSWTIVNSWVPQVNRNWKYLDWNFVYRIGTLHFSRLLWGKYRHILCFHVQDETKICRFTMQEIMFVM